MNSVKSIKTGIYCLKNISTCLQPSYKSKRIGNSQSLFVQMVLVCLLVSVIERFCRYLFDPFWSPLTKVQHFASCDETGPDLSTIQLRRRRSRQNEFKTLLLDYFCQSRYVWYVHKCLESFSLESLYFRSLPQLKLNGFFCC